MAGQDGRIAPMSKDRYAGQLKAADPADKEDIVITEGFVERRFLSD
jgi:hypothetical protein